MSTPTPDAIETAARAMFYQQVGLQPPYPLWDDADAVEKDNCRNDAQLALSAAYPLMEAQAKAEALREAADEFRFCPDWRYRASRPMATEDYLRARAATIEGKDS